MNKCTLMQKQLVRQGIIAVILVGLAAAAMMQVDTMAQDALQHKTEIESALRADESHLRELKSKIDLAGSAEKQFAEVKLRRGEPPFEAKTDRLVQLLQDAKRNYRLSGFKPLNLPVDVQSKRTEFANQNYDVMVREGMTVEFDAISDVHAYSFLQYLLSDAPGFLRLQSLDMQRKEDLSPQAIAQLQAGQTLGLVTTKAQFVWAGIKAKPESIEAISAKNKAAGGGQ